MREQSKDQSGALLISLLVKDVMRNNLQTTELQLLIDKIISSVENEDMLKQHVQDPDLRLKLLDYGLWKETLGREEQENAPTQGLPQGGDGIALEASEVEKRRGLGELRGKVFGQTMDLISTVLDKLNITAETISEWEEEIGQAVINSISGMDGDALEQRSADIDNKMKKTEAPEEQRGFVSELLGGDIWSRLQNSMEVHQYAVGLASSLLPNLDKRSVSLELKGQISLMDINKLAELKDTKNKAPDHEDDLIQRQNFFLESLLGHNRWKELTQSSTIEGMDLSALTELSLSSSTIEEAQGNGALLTPAQQVEAGKSGGRGTS